MTFPVPDDEDKRLAALRALEVLDTEAEPAYDDIVQLAAAICRTPIAAISLIDADRQWAKALVGLPHFDAAREHSICARTIVAEEGVLVIPDARSDARWVANPMSVGPPGLRFYAGAAITTADGLALGSLCVADRSPRKADDDAVAALRRLARQVAGILELRGSSRRLDAARAELNRLAQEDALTGLTNGSRLVDRVDQALREHRRNGGGLGVLLGDLNSLGRVNDELGHPAGDELLRVVAGRLGSAARGSDTVARLGGDAFAVLCPGAESLATLDIAAARLRAAVALPVGLGAAQVTPRLCMGVALAEPGDDSASLLRRANADLNEARHGAPVLS